jgi:GntR family transcriptional regulator
MVGSGKLRPATELPSVRVLALAHAVNPMTISRAYGLLEAEGLLERNRGKPMTVAAQSRAQAHVSRRLAQIEPQLEHLVLAARQLQLSEAEVVKALRRAWQQTEAIGVDR